jgi:hypothetical protein
MEIIISEVKETGTIVKVDKDGTYFQIVYWVIPMDLERTLSLRISIKS